MNRLVVIHKERLAFFSKDKYEVVLGDYRVRERLSQTVEHEGHGYRLVFDAALPSTQRALLDVGMPASIRIDIDSLRSNKFQVPETSVQLLTVLFDLAPRVQAAAEQIISQASAASAGNLQSSIDRKLRLATVFPELARDLRTALNAAREFVPYLMIEISETMNITRALDEALDEAQRRQSDVLQTLMTKRLTTAFHPEDEYRARREYYENLRQSWPGANPPSELEMDTLRAIVERQRDSLSRALLPSFVPSEPPEVVGTRLGMGDT